MGRERSGRWRAVVAGGVCVAVTAGLAGCGSGPPHPAAGPAGRSATPATRGSGTGVPPATTAPAAPGARRAPDLATVAWTATVAGAVYAQPLVVGDRVVVATEADEVYALDLATGRVLWGTSIGRPLTGVAAAAGCGNIDPLGITSTPVFDPATGVVYVVGEITEGAGPAAVVHELVGLDLASGRVVRRAGADPPGVVDRLHLLQRPGLVLAGGRVDVAFGGLYGDCGFYHGWVVGVPVTAGVPAAVFDATPGGSGGAIWQGGAPPAVASGGELYVATGNQNAQGTAGFYESVVKLSPALAPEASFRDTQAVDDEDFGTGAPVLLPGGVVFAVGKTDVGYLLRRSDLGLIARIPGVCGSDPDGRVAYDPATDALYVPCRAGGIQQVDLASRRRGWRSGQANSSPLLGAGALWALAYPAGTVEELDPVTGAVRQSARVGPVANFATPALAGGHLLVATTTGRVVALGAS